MVRPLLRSFAGGEITPELFGRLDLDKFQTGLAKAQNFIVLPHGPAANRPGFAYVNETKATTVRLIPFAYSVTQTMVLEFGGGYVRFHTNGGTLLESSKAVTGLTAASPGVFNVVGHSYVTGDWAYLTGIGGPTTLNGRFYVVTVLGANTISLTTLAGVPVNTTALPAYTSGGTIARVYTVATPYTAGELFDLHYTQSSDVLTIVHPSLAPRELRRLGATSWALTEAGFTPLLSAPTGVSVTMNTGAASGTYYAYKVEAIQSGSVIGESPAAGVYQDFTVPGAVVRLYWPAVEGATSYRISRAVGLNFFEIGTTTSLTFTDTNLPTGAAVAVGGVPAQPSYLTAVAGTTNEQHYIVTAASGVEESYSSTSVQASNDLTVSGAYNTVAWSAVTSAQRYNVYKRKNGLYGYIGTTSELTFKDDNIIPDLSQTPPEVSTPFTGVGNYPSTVTYMEQRRCFAATDNRPQNVWMTRSATEGNLTQSVPVRDDDAILFRIAANQQNRIRHLVPLGDLIALTAGGEFRIYGAGTDVLTPASVTPKPQSYVGANNVQPMVAENSVLYAQAQGGHIRELAYSGDGINGRLYNTNDISILAPHLFDGFTVVDMAYSRTSSCPILWVVRSDGVLLGMTYVPGQNVRAWHRHTTDGLFKSVCCVTEGDEDVLYAAIERTVNGRTTRYIERQHTRQFSEQADAFFVDSGLTYDGAPTTTVTGLWHLEGETVSALADGAVVLGLTVTSGTVTLPAAASVVHVGLPISGELQTLPLSWQVDGFGQGIVKNVNKAHLRVANSGAYHAGPTEGTLREVKRRTTEPYGTPPALKTGWDSVLFEPKWDADGGVTIGHNYPLPLTVLAMALEVTAGG